MMAFSISIKSLFVVLAVLWGYEAASAMNENSETNTDNSNSDSNNMNLEEYGVDVSWPTHHHFSPLAGSGRFSEYRTFLQGCSERFSNTICTQNEDDRLELNYAQPRHQTNFTSAGYAKVKAPTKTFQLLQKFWNKYNETSAVRKEDWSDGSTYVNHWASPTDVLLLDDADHPTTMMSSADRKFIAGEVRDVLERWSQTSSLFATSMYGIRVYHEGSVLAPHVDRLPLVLSAIINVAQDVREPWPLELVGHDGVVKNVTMEPGTMVLYESHSVIHGRPFALEGDYYANVFLHFEPLGYTEALERKMESLRPSRNMDDAKELFEKALAKSQEDDAAVAETENQQLKSKREKVRTLPSYIEEDSPEAKQWRQEYAFYRQERKANKHNTRTSIRTVHGVTSAHVYSATGNLAKLKEAAKEDHESLFRADSNGWKPLHEAARAGKTEAVRFLLQQGADVNERTNGGKGANALWWAKQQLPENHPTIRLLQEYGAAAIGPFE